MELEREGTTKHIQQEERGGVGGRGRGESKKEMGGEGRTAIKALVIPGHSVQSQVLL